MSKVSIVSDGFPRNTTVKTEDGETLHVKSVSWSLESGKVSAASIELTMCEAVLLGDGKCVVMHPRTGRPIEIVGYVLPDGSTLKILEDKPQ